MKKENRAIDGKGVETVRKIWIGFKGYEVVKTYGIWYNRYFLVKSGIVICARNISKGGPEWQESDYDNLGVSRMKELYRILPKQPTQL